MVLFCATYAYPADVEMSRKYFREGKWVKALNAYGDITNASQEDLLMLSDAYIYSENYQPAIDILDRAVKLYNSPDFHISLTAVEEITNPGRKNLQRLDALILKWPDNPRAWRLFGLAMMSTDLDDASIYYFYEAISRDPNDYMSYFYIGLVYEIHMLFDEAIPHYKKAIKLNPIFAQAVNNLGYAYKEKHFWTYAADMYRKAVELWPENAGYHYNLGNALSHKFQFKEAFQEYIKAIALDHTFAKAHYNLGRAYVRMDKYKEALAEFELYLKYWNSDINPEDAPPPEKLESEIEELKNFIKELENEAQKKKAVVK